MKYPDQSLAYSPVDMPQMPATPLSDVDYFGDGPVESKMVFTPPSFGYIPPSDMYATACAVYEQLMQTNMQHFSHSALLNTDTKREKSQVKRRRRLTVDETQRLNHIFQHRTTKPDSLLRQQLADELGMTARAVQVWFQNRRAKMKRERELLDRASEQNTANAISEGFMSLGQTDMGGMMDYGEFGGRAIVPKWFIQ
jgi:hypothetical protein